MITVADILALPAFERVESIAPCPGAMGHSVHNVGILDISPKLNGYSVYFPGEFIVTNLGFANGVPEQAEEALIAMMKRRVSGIAIKRVYNPPITDKVRAASTEMGVPVFLYDGGYHEMVAYQALDLIMREGQEENKESEILSLIAYSKKQDILSTLQSICGTTGSTIRCMAVRPQSKSDDFSRYALLRSLRTAFAEVLEARDDIESIKVHRFYENYIVFIVYSLSQPSKNQVPEVVRTLRQLGNLYIGVGDEVPFAEGDITLRQSLALIEISKNTQKEYLTWFQAHHDAFKYAVQTDRLCAYTAQQYLDCFQAYDKANGSDLALTMKTIASTFGDFKAASTELHQHQNTIRYRLNKAKSILGVPDMPDREFFGLLNFIFTAEPSAELSDSPIIRTEDAPTASV